MILYAGFILCFTGLWLRKIIYIITGIAALYIANVVRCGVLGWIGIEYPRHFDFAHKYFFNLIIYSIAFIFWVFYVKGLPKKDDAAKAS
jgi:exosortase/archaeosortase family protein